MLQTPSPPSKSSPRRKKKGTNNIVSNVDVCATCVGLKKPPTLPLREEVESLGFELVYNAKGTAWKGVRSSQKKKIQQAELKAKEFSDATRSMSFLQSMMVHHSPVATRSASKIKKKKRELIELSNKSLQKEALSYDEYLVQMLRQSSKKRTRKQKKKKRNGTSNFNFDFSDIEDEEEDSQHSSSIGTSTTTSNVSLHDSMTTRPRQVSFSLENKKDTKKQNDCYYHPPVKNDYNSPLVTHKSADTRYSPTKKSWGQSLIRNLFPSIEEVIYPVNSLSQSFSVDECCPSPQNKYDSSTTATDESFCSDDDVVDNDENDDGVDERGKMNNHNNNNHNHPDILNESGLEITLCDEDKYGQQKLILHDTNSQEYFDQPIPIVYSTENEILEDNHSHITESSDTPPQALHRIMSPNNDSVSNNVFEQKTPLQQNLQRDRYEVQCPMHVSVPTDEDTPREDRNLMNNDESKIYDPKRTQHEVQIEQSSEDQIICIDGYNVGEHKVIKDKYDVENFKKKKKNQAFLKEHSNISLSNKEDKMESPKVYEDEYFQNNPINLDRLGNHIFEYEYRNDVPMETNKENKYPLQVLLAPVECIGLASSDDCAGTFSSVSHDFQVSSSDSYSLPSFSWNAQGYNDIIKSSNNKTAISSTELCSNEIPQNKSSLEKNTDKAIVPKEAEKLLDNSFKIDTILHPNNDILDSCEEQQSSDNRVLGGGCLTNEIHDFPIVSPNVDANVVDSKQPSINLEYSDINYPQSRLYDTNHTDEIPSHVNYPKESNVESKSEMAKADCESLKSLASNKPDNNVSEEAIFQNNERVLATEVHEEDNLVDLENTPRTSPHKKRYKELDPLHLAIAEFERIAIKDTSSHLDISILNNSKTHVITEETNHTKKQNIVDRRINHIGSISTSQQGSEKNEETAVSTEYVEEMLMRENDMFTEEEGERNDVVVQKPSMLRQTKHDAARQEIGNVSIKYSSTNTVINEKGIQSNVDEVEMIRIACDRDDISQDTKLYTQSRKNQNITCNNEIQSKLRACSGVDLAENNVILESNDLKQECSRFDEKNCSRQTRIQHKLQTECSALQKSNIIDTEVLSEFNEHGPSHSTDPITDTNLSLYTSIGKKFGNESVEFIKESVNELYEEEKLSLPATKSYRGFCTKEKINCSHPIKNSKDNMTAFRIEENRDPTEVSHSLKDCGINNEPNQTVRCVHAFQNIDDLCDERLSFNTDNDEVKTFMEIQLMIGEEMDTVLKDIVTLCGKIENKSDSLHRHFSEYYT